MTAVAPMPADWQPATVVTERFGKQVYLWTWRGHELAYRMWPIRSEEAEVAAWEAFRAETWSVRARLAAGETVIPYAHAKRHDPAARRVSTPSVTLPEFPPAPTDEG